MSGLVHHTDQRRYHLYRKETDMRKAFDTLSRIIQNELGRQVMNGDAFHQSAAHPFKTAVVGT